jgi:hypothetical protein
MMQVTLKWIVVLAALFAAGPLAASFVSHLTLVDGGHAASLFTDGSFARGLLAGVLVLALATVMGIASGRLVARDMGLTAAGLVIAWAAWRFSTVDRAASRIGGQGMLTVLAIEGLVVGLAGVAMAAAIGATSRERQPRAAIVGAMMNEGALGEDVPRSAMLFSGLLGLLVGGSCVWVVAVEALKGQCVMAAVTGGIACGAASQLYASTRRVRLGILVPMLAMALLAGVSPLITRSIHGQSIVLDAMAGRLFPLGKLGPLDWLAGALLGVPIGLAWANSMLEKEPSGVQA